MRKTHSKGIKKNSYLFLTCGFILLILYTISFLTPLLWALMTSFKNEMEFVVDKFSLPSKLDFSNYVYVYKNLSVPVIGLGNIYIEEQFFNAIVYTVLCSITHTLTPCICAYAVAKFDFKFGKFIYGIVIVTMILPIIGNLPSQIQMAKITNLYDSFLGTAIMKGHFLGTNFLIFYASFKSLPNDFREAAQIDGATQWQVLTKISLPLTITTIGAVGLLSFITYWNDYTTAMIFLPTHPTIAYGLYYFTHGSTNQSSFVTVWVSACMLVTLPIFIVFLIFKNKLIGNMTMGGIKG